MRFAWAIQHWTGRKFPADKSCYLLHLEASEGQHRPMFRGCGTRPNQASKQETLKSKNCMLGVRMCIMVRGCPKWSGG